MSFARTYRSQGGPCLGEYRSSLSRDNSTISNITSTTDSYYTANNNYIGNYNNPHDFSRKSRECFSFNYGNTDDVPSLKRRKFSASAWESSGRPYHQPNTYENASLTYTNSSNFPATTQVDANVYTTTTCKRDRSKFEEEDVVFMSRDEIERCSPSRKDGIDASHETHLRYSYCAFLQNLGVQLELPQTTIGTAMVLCHRFFVRRSHACHDRFLIATAALFLAAKSEETPCPLNNVLRTSCEIFHKQDLSLLSYLLPIDWFEQYRERVTEAEQMILTTLNFELNVQHPYAPLTSILDKLGLSQSVLVNLALSLVSEGAYRRVACACLYDILSWRIDMLFIKSFISHLKLNYRYVVEIPAASELGTGVDVLSLDGYKMIAIVLLLLSAICRRYMENISPVAAFLVEYTMLHENLIVHSSVASDGLFRLRSSLWLQFKPHQIAAGAAYLAAKSLNMDLTACQNSWQEFRTPPSVLKVVVQQLMELF